MSLFGGLNLKVKKDAESQPKQPNPGGGGSSLFGFLNSQPSSTSSTSSSSSSSSSSTPAAAPSEGSKTESKGFLNSAFGFIGSSSSTPSTTTAPAPLSSHTTADQPSEDTSPSPLPSAAPPSAPSSFSFLSGQQPSSDRSASAIAATLAEQQEEDLLAPPAVIKPANIKKKRGSRLPGFARRDGSSVDSTSETGSKHSIDQDLEENGNNEEGKGDEDVVTHAVIPEQQEQEREQGSVQEAESLDQTAQVEELSQEANVEIKQEVPSVPKSEFSFLTKAVSGDSQEGDSHREMQEKSNGEDDPEDPEEAVNALKELTTPPSQPPTQTPPSPVEQDQEKKAVLEAQGELAELLDAFNRAATQFAKGLKQVDIDLEAAFVSIERNEVEAKSLADRLTSLEEEQNAALEAEDFDKAERLQRTIDAVSRSVGEVESRRVVLNRDVELLEKKKHQVYENQLKSIDVISELLTDCSKKETDKAHQLNVQTKEEIKQAKVRLDEEEDLLRIELEGIVTDLQVVENELDQINSKVDAGTVELRGQREEWESKIAEVDEEIAALERELEEKRSQRATLDTHLQQVNSGIQAVRSKYESRLHELETRREAVDEKQKVSQQRTEEILKARSDLDSKGEQAAQTASEMERAAAEIISQLEILNDVASQLGQGAASSSASAASTAQVVGGAAVQQQIKKLNDTIEINNQSVNFSTRQVQEIESGMVEETRKLFDIDSKLPALNEQKKLAVSTRNFKEAGRVASIIKDLTTEKTELEETIQSSRSKLEELNQSIAAKHAENEHLASSVKELKDGLNEALLRDLQARRIQLRSFCKKVRASGSVDPGTFGATVLFLLETEMHACEDQANRISVKICGDEHLAALTPDENERDQALEQQEDLSSDREKSQEQVDDRSVEEGDAGGLPDQDEVEPATHEEGNLQNDIEENPPKQNVLSPEEVEALREKISRLESEVNNAVEQEEFEVAAELDVELEELRSQLENAKLDADVEREEQEDVEEQSHQKAAADEGAVADKGEEQREDELEQPLEVDDDDEGQALDHEEDPTVTEAGHVDAVIASDDSDSEAPLPDQDVLDEDEETVGLRTTD